MTHGRTPLDEESARCKDLYLTTHNIHNRETFTSSAGFKTTIPANETSQTYALDRTAIMVLCPYKGGKTAQFVL